MSNIYKHYKGGLYTVLTDNATDSEYLNRIVVYQSINDGKIWIRPYSNFFESITVNGEFINRFEQQ